MADGFNVALGSLSVLSPQPSSTGVQATDRSYNVDGTYIEQGLFVELSWNTAPNTTAYQAILTAFGILSATSNDVTVYVPNQVGTYARYNGKAIRPEVGRDMRRRNYFYRDIVVLVKDLALSS